MIKLLYIVSTLEATGPTNQLLNLIKNIDPKKFLVIILTLSSEPFNSMKKNFDSLGIKIVSLSLSKFIGFVFAKKKIKEFIDLFNPDIIHTQGIRADYFSPKLKNSSFLLSTIRNFPKEDYTTRYGLFIGNFMAHVHLKLIKNIPHLACSRSLAEKLEKINIKLNYIQNGVDYDFFNIQADKFRLRKENHLPMDKKIFLFSGPLIKRKNISFIISAIKNFENVIFLLVGDGAEKAKLEEVAKGSSNIIFLGWKNNIRDFYLLADFYVSASFSEGLSNSVMEAMACGLPVILSDIDSHREFFELIDYNYFFNPSEVGELGEVMRKIISADYKLLSEQVKKIIKNKFSAQGMSEKYQNVYINSLNKSRSFT